MIRFCSHRLAPGLYCIRTHNAAGELTSQFIAVIDKGTDGRWRVYRPAPTPDNPNRTESTHFYFRTRRDAMAYVVTMGQT